MQSEEVFSKLAILDREEIENAIRNIHNLRANAQFDALERYLAPDAVFEYVGDSINFPYAGIYTGKKAIIALYNWINTEIEMLDSRMVERIIDGDRAFSRRKVEVQHRGTGVHDVHEIWDTWKFRDGLVTHSVKLVDTRAYDRLQGE